MSYSEIITAQYMDGLSARLVPVNLSLDGKHLRITGNGVEESWRISAVRIWSDAPDGSLILGHRREDARLMIDAGHRDALADWLPSLMNEKRRRRGTWILGGSLTALAASMTAFMFLGLPALSVPLAQHVPLEVEYRMGRQANAMVSMFSQECEANEDAATALADLASRFQTASGSPFELRMRVVDADFPNAFAMPGGNIVITDDLIELMESPEELAGVLAHETAHVAQRHVMAAQLREMGFGVVLDILLGGNSGAGQELARAGASLESLRHSRDAEAEADAYALEYLGELDMNPQGLAAFFDTLTTYIESEIEGEMTENSDGDETPDEAGASETSTEPKPEPGWLDSLLSTHPDTQGRADSARDAAQAVAWSGGQVMDDVSWQAIRAVCQAETEARAERSLNVLDRLGEILVMDDDKPDADNASATPEETE